MRGSAVLLLVGGILCAPIAATSRPAPRRPALRAPSTTHPPRRPRRQTVRPPMLLAPRPTGGSAAAAAGVTPLRRILSPDRRRAAELTASGVVRLEGRAVRCGPGRALGVPVWRRDGAALAFLQVAAVGGPRLIVLPDLDPDHPLVWQLPPLVEPTAQIFWIAHQRIGVGPRPPVPQLIVSWTTTVAGLLRPWPRGDQPAAPLTAAR